MSFSSYIIGSKFLTRNATYNQLIGELTDILGIFHLYPHCIYLPILLWVIFPRASAHCRILVLETKNFDGNLASLQ
ncbi:hypothetical protein L2E82_16116 [Cichorium intybus]|uniref:Uncharacterized protein n=1 Tax=Cichorium intybus TaxID=13427 RepID=A0ACB9F4M5_CICIN|nr:hypothetical protein L2E82_16116 [Cichorium intybus]